MINLDQVRTLELKVKQAVQLIVQLRRENDTLRNRLSDTEVRFSETEQKLSVSENKLQELETLLNSLKASQQELESGIQSAITELEGIHSDEVSAEPVALDQPATDESLDRVESSSRDELAESASETSIEAALPDEGVEPIHSVELDETNVILENDLEAGYSQAAEPAFEMVEPTTPPEEEAEDQQPGLGIF